MPLVPILLCVLATVIGLTFGKILLSSIVFVIYKSTSPLELLSAEGLIGTMMFISIHYQCTVASQVIDRGDWLSHDMLI